METARFFFWEILKTVGLAFLGLLCAKAITVLRGSAAVRTNTSGAAPDPEQRTSAWDVAVTAAWIGIGLYTVVFLLVGLGARAIGNNLAAEFDFMAGRDNLSHGQPVRGYSNALRAVQMRRAQVKYWQVLSAAKLGLRQYRSVLADEAIITSLEGGELAEEDAMRFAFAHFFLGEYDQSITILSQLIRQERLYAAPYVLLGMAYTAEQKYPDAERTFLTVLQIYPSHEGAVEGLAHQYYLTGSPDRALAVLDQTARFPFDPDARRRFEQLQALYREAQAEGPRGAMTN
jgi:tetratricopeptide (TPR) repeat protein